MAKKAQLKKPAKKIKLKRTLLKNLTVKDASAIKGGRANKGSAIPVF